MKPTRRKVKKVVAKKVKRISLRLAAKRSQKLAENKEESTPLFDEVSFSFVIISKDRDYQIERVVGRLDCGDGEWDEKSIFVEWANAVVLLDDFCTATFRTERRMNNEMVTKINIQGNKEKGAHPLFQLCRYDKVENEYLDGEKWDGRSVVVKWSLGLVHIEAIDPYSNEEREKLIDAIVDAPLVKFDVKIHEDCREGDVELDGISICWEGPPENSASVGAQSVDGNIAEEAMVVDEE